MAGTEVAQRSLARVQCFSAGFRSRGAVSSSGQLRSSCTTNTQVGRGEPVGQPRGLRAGCSPWLAVLECSASG